MALAGECSQRRRHEKIKTSFERQRERDRGRKGEQESAVSFAVTRMLNTLIIKRFGNICYYVSALLC